MPGSACLPEKAGFQEFRLGLAAPPHNVRQAHRQKVGCRYSSMASLSSPPRRVEYCGMYRTEPCGKVKDEVNFASLMFPPVSAEFDLPSGLKCEHISEWIAVMQRGQSREPDW